MAKIQAGGLSASSDVATESKQDDIITLLEASDDFEGAPVTVGTTAVALTFSGTTTSIAIQADHDNAGSIWFGKSNIDNTGANAMGRLEAGESVSIELDDTSNAIYAVASTVSQKIFKIALV